MAVALVSLIAFAMAAMGAWIFVIVLLGLVLDEDAAGGGLSTLADWERVLVHGVAGLAAVVVFALCPAFGWARAWRPLRRSPSGGRSEGGEAGG